MTRAAAGLLLALLLGRAGVAAAEARPTELATPGGMLRIVQLDRGQLGRHFRVELAGRTVLTTGGDDDHAAFADFPVPAILGHYTRAAAPYAELVLFEQHDWGNACNGGPLWFLGIRRDGTWKRLKPIDFCGGRDPRVTEADGTVTLRIEGDPRNRGSGRVALQVWTYRAGRVTRR